MNNLPEPNPDIILKIEEANKWKNDRLNTYELWNNQLDKLWHDIDNGILDKNGEWYKAIKQIKEDNPKPANLEELEEEIEEMITAEREAGS